MKTKMNVTVMAILFAVSSIIFTGCSKNDDTHASTGPNNVSGARGDDQSTAQLAAAWWNWTLSFDKATNPYFDASAALGAQNGTVYFLAGAKFNNPANRTATVNAGQTIFAPILSAIDNNDGSFGDVKGQELYSTMLADVSGLVDGVDQVSATLDGNSITGDRVHTSLFEVKGSADNGIVGGMTGKPQKAVADGYWIRISPLSVGTHTLHTVGGITGPGIAKDVTYTITVVPAAN